MKFLLAALIAASIIFLFGCVQVSPPESCASLSATDQPGCIYYSAVMNQDPYACYAIQDKAQRTVCLKDAIDPNAKKAITKKKIVPAGIGRTTPGLNASAAMPHLLTGTTENATGNPAPPAGGLRTLNSSPP